MAGCGEGGLGGAATGIRPADLLIIAGGYDGESFEAGLSGPVVNVAEDGELDESVAERQQGGGLIDEQQQVGFGKCFEEFADLVAEFRWLNGIGRGSTAGVQFKKFRELDAARQQESGRIVFGRGRSGALIGNRQDLQPENDGGVGLAYAFDTADGTENCVEFADGRTTAKFDGIEIRGATGECGGECSEERDSGRRAGCDIGRDNKGQQPLGRHKQECKKDGECRDDEGSEEQPQFAAWRTAECRPRRFAGRLLPAMFWSGRLLGARLRRATSSPAAAVLLSCHDGESLRYAGRSW